MPQLGTNIGYDATFTFRRYVTLTFDIECALLVFQYFTDKIRKDIWGKM